MEQEQSEKLLKHLSHIREMVDYLELSGHLLSSGAISSTDHRTLVGVVNTANNSKAMEHLVHMLKLRKGGFGAFVQALRANDYNWLAQQMDPEPEGKAEEEPKGLFGALRRRKSRRNSEAHNNRMSAETVFTSYRQSFPMDLSSSCRSINHCHFTTTPMSPMMTQRSTASTNLTKSFDSLYLHNDYEPKSTSTSSSNNIKPRPASALLLNIPDPDPGLKDSDVVSKIAKELHFPLSSCLTSLKRISVKSKSPKAKERLRAGKLLNSKTLNLKIKFKSKESMLSFVDGVNSASSALGGLKGVPLQDPSPSADQQMPTDTTNNHRGGWFKRLLNKR